MHTFVVIVLLWTATSLAVGALWAWSHWSGRQGVSTREPVPRGAVSVPRPRAQAEQPAQHV